MADHLHLRLWFWPFSFEVFSGNDSPFLSIKCVYSSKFCASSTPINWSAVYQNVPFSDESSLDVWISSMDVHGSGIFQVNKIKWL